MPKVQSVGIDKKSLTDIQLTIAQEAINLYNELYDAQYTLDNIPDYLKKYLEGFVVVTLFGWNDLQDKDYPTETLLLLQAVFGDNYEKYAGINESIAAQLQDNPDIDKDKFAEDRSFFLFAGLFSAFQIIQAELAKNDKREWVGVITVGDDKVRDTHVPNNRRYWLVGSRRDFSRDFNCRCSYYYFKTEQEAISAGFVKI